MYVFGYPSPGCLLFPPYFLLMSFSLTKFPQYWFHRLHHFSFHLLFVSYVSFSIASTSSIFQRLALLALWIFWDQGDETNRSMVFTLYFLKQFHYQRIISSIPIEGAITMLLKPSQTLEDEKIPNLMYEFSLSCLVRDYKNSNILYEYLVSLSLTLLLLLIILLAYSHLSIIIF